MANRIKGLDEKIYKSAYQEFKEFGYKDASINRIAKNAGVTTGAIYVRYKDKDALFSAVVKPVIDAFSRETEKIKQGYRVLAADRSWDKLAAFDREAFDFIVNFMLQNKELITLLIEQSSGSSVSGFKDKIIEMKAFQIEKYIDQILAAEAERGNPVSVSVPKEEIILLISAQYHILFEALRRGYSAEQTKIYIDRLKYVFEGGLKKLLVDFSSELKKR